MGETQKTEIVAEMENAEVTAFGKKDLRTFNTLKSNIEKGFSRASDAYITCLLYTSCIWRLCPSYSDDEIIFAGK